MEAGDSRRYPWQLQAAPAGFLRPWNPLWRNGRCALRLTRTRLRGNAAVEPSSAGPGRRPSCALRSVTFEMRRVGAVRVANTTRVVNTYTKRIGRDGSTRQPAAPRSVLTGFFIAGTRYALSVVPCSRTNLTTTMPAANRRPSSPRMPRSNSRNGCAISSKGDTSDPPRRHRVCRQNRANATDPIRRARRTARGVVYPRYAGACQPASAHSSPLTAELASMKQIASAISSGRISRLNCVNGNMCLLM